jgi:hypothetical protein
VLTLGCVKGTSISLKTEIKRLKVRILNIQIRLKTSSLTTKGITLSLGLDKESTSPIKDKIPKVLARVFHSGAKKA